MRNFLYLLLSLYYASCSSDTEKQPEIRTENRRSEHHQPQNQQQSNQDQSIAHCDVGNEKNERLQGILFSNNCREIAKVSGALKDFFSLSPGTRINSLSTDKLAVSRTPGGTTRVDATLVPQKANGSPYANFTEFYQASLLDGARLHATFRELANIVDSLNLNIHGYRLVIDEIPPNGIFSWRLFGGEPLGNTVQIAGQNARNHGPIVDMNAPYSAAHAFNSHVNESFKGVGYAIHSLGTHKAMTFKDVNPLARVHMLAIPKGPYVSSYDFAKKASAEEMQVLLKGIHQIIVDNIAVGSGSFRFISNAGGDANQSQPHLHFHALRGDSTHPLGIPAIARSRHRIMKSFNINEIVGHIDDETLVVFDIDATLAWVPGHTWPYEAVLDRSLAEGASTLAMWQALLKATSNAGSQAGAKFISLTARPMPANPNDGAHVDLGAVGLNASYAWVNSFDAGPSYRDGVLYASHSDKGTLLKQFLAAARSRYPFKKVITIDDRLENVTSEYDSLKVEAGIESSISFWYVGALHPKTNTTIGLFWPKPILWAVATRQRTLLVI